MDTSSVTSVFPTQTVSYVPGAGVRLPPPNPVAGWFILIFFLFSRYVVQKKIILVSFIFYYPVTFHL